MPIISVQKEWSPVRKILSQIVVTNRNGIPVHISDVGIVRFGSPKRFGAMPKDGEGKCVGGIAMMLKGANAALWLVNWNNE